MKLVKIFNFAGPVKWCFALLFLAALAKANVEDSSEGNLEQEIKPESFDLGQRSSTFATNIYKVPDPLIQWTI